MDRRRFVASSALAGLGALGVLGRAAGAADAAPSAAASGARVARRAGSSARRRATVGPTSPLPGEPAPAPGTQPRRTAADAGALTAALPDLTSPTVFYSPHADDETLSMGVAIGNELAAGRDVLLVLVTLGCSAVLLDSLNGVSSDRVTHVRHDPVAEGYLGPLTGGVLSAQTVAASRAVEWRSAAGTYAAFAGTAGAGRLVATVVGRSEGLSATEAGDVVRQVALRYPGAAHATTSWTDGHPDHAACGAGLRDAVARGVVARARYFVQPGHQSLADDDLADAGLAPTTALVPAAGVGDAVRRAVAPYRAWNPAAGCYGFGYRSVTALFDAVVKNPVGWEHA